MAKKKLTAEILKKSYYDHLRSVGKRPVSVYSFMNEMDRKEADFYEHFASLNALENSIHGAFLEQTIELLHKDESYQDFDSENKLLSFYFTYFELLSKNRSFVLLTLKESDLMQKGNNLKKVRSTFINYIETLDLDFMQAQLMKNSKWLTKGGNELVWAQLLFIMKYWLRDDSTGFENTDILIEKSVKTSFSLVDNPAITNIMDLGKFLFKHQKSN